MITGVHAIIYTKQADAVRAFFRDVLRTPHVDAGRGWLIFALPPAELGIHPSEDGESHELYLMCDDIEAHARRARGEGRHRGQSGLRPGVGTRDHDHDRRGCHAGLYEPRHPTALHLSKP